MLEGLDWCVAGVAHVRVDAADSGEAVASAHAAASGFRSMRMLCRCGDRCRRG